MKRIDQRGVVDAWALAFFSLLILFFGAVIFGFWAFSGMQDYKNNVDPKIAAAVAQAQEETSVKKDQEFVEKEKEPLKTYKGPSAYGSLSIKYPKTWSAYVDESGKGAQPIDGSFNPGFIPGLNSGNNVALRVQVINNDYAEVTRSMESLVKNGKVAVKPFAAKKVPDAVGVRGDGEIVSGKQGAMVLIPLRDKTLKIWTEASQYVKDFNKIILPNINFSP